MLGIVTTPLIYLYQGLNLFTPCSIYSAVKNAFNNIARSFEQKKTITPLERQYQPKDRLRTNNAYFPLVDQVRY